MLIRTEPKCLPNTECMECHKIGGLTMIGVDSDNSDCPVVHCDACDEQYSLNIACVDPTDMEADNEKAHYEKMVSQNPWLQPDGPAMRPFSVDKESEEFRAKHLPRPTDGGW